MTAVASELALHPRAQRELDGVPRRDFERIDATLWALRDIPRPMGVHKLEGDLHRVRVGDWRVLYVILDHERRIVIVRVARRSERTYKFLP